MGLNLSKEEREWLENQLRSAEPYDEDDPILLIYDNSERDPLRWNATMAKRLLKQAGLLDDGD